MPPDRGRASKACTACRKQKTRCYESSHGRNACLRCDRLGLSCSLDHIVDADDGHIRESKNTSDNDRLDRLEKVVNALVKRLSDEPELERSFDKAPPSPRPEDRTIVNSETSDAPAAPIALIRDVASEVGQRDNAVSPQSAPGLKPRDIVEKGLVTSQDASSLLTLFHEHYSRWVSFDRASSHECMLTHIRKSPLLLSACCLIAVRHTTQEMASSLAQALFVESKYLLSNSLLVVPQTLEFFQATLILSLWSTTIGQSPLSIDSWLVSGYALQHCLASDAIKTISKAKPPPTYSKRELDGLCIWNHLCLVHLHYCVGTHRKAMLDSDQIKACREILAFEHATNFETRIVAEINLYWIIYESCSKGRVDLPKTQAALHAWKSEWRFLFDQPRAHLIQMGFHFAQLLTYDLCLRSRSAAVRQSLLSEMVRSSAAILRLGMDTTDSRTQHLTDHIYHMITFAAVTLCRLVHMYKNQLATSHNVAELDSLILELVAWLHSIGLPCHVAYMLGDVVDAFHKKLRPDARPSPFEEVDWFAQADLAALFPDFIGTVSLESGTGGLLPDWESYTSGPPT